jgi:hypothetical protein
MDKAYPPDAWKRLGHALELRRMQLGYGHRQRHRFMRERGTALEPGSLPSDKTLARLESGERDTYSKTTVAAVEVLYALAPGSFWDSVESGQLTVVASHDPVGDDLRAAIQELPGLTDAEKQTVAAVARGLRAERTGLVPALPADRPRFPDDPVLDRQAEEFWNLKTFDIATKLGYIERARLNREASRESAPARRAAAG